VKQDTSTFFEVAPAMLDGKLIQRKSWGANALGFGPFGKLSTFWWPKNQQTGDWQLTPSSHHTLTKDDFAALDWRVICE
jgi:hypothetical protein